MPRLLIKRNCCLKSGPRCLPFARALVIILGDFSFAVTGDQRLDVASGKPIGPCEPIAKKFDEFFSGYAEMHQDAFTRRERRDDCLSKLRRLDRIYTNAPTGLLLDIEPITGTAMGVSSANLIGDHVPVCCRFLVLKVAGGRCCIPSWIS